MKLTLPKKGEDKVKKPPKADVKPAKADKKPAKTDVKPPKADVKPAKADKKPAKTDVKPAKTDVKPAKTGKKPVKRGTGKWAKIVAQVVQLSNSGIGPTEIARRVGIPLSSVKWIRYDIVTGGAKKLDKKLPPSYTGFKIKMYQRRPKDEKKSEKVEKPKSKVKAKKKKK